MNSYKVLGPKAIYGVEPGDTLERDLSPEQEERLVARGAIEPLEGNVPVEAGTVDRTPPTFTDPDGDGEDNNTNDGTGEDSPEEGASL